MSQEVRDLMKHLWPVFQAYWYLVYVTNFYDTNESFKCLSIITIFILCPKVFVCVLIPVGLIIFSSYGTFRNYKLKPWNSENNLMQKNID